MRTIILIAAAVAVLAPSAAVAKECWSDDWVCQLIEGSKPDFIKKKGK